ncbi:hypothetical protein DACRYDRAFT_25043, partial [Dacryopinax primogenitus]
MHTYSSLSIRSSSYNPSFRGSSFAISASTKPTTLLSIDTAPAPPATARGAPSIHFSHLPPSSPTPSASAPHTPTQAALGLPSTSGPTTEDKLSSLGLKPRFPRYSKPDPAHNPDPSSPALDNASILTLASTTADRRPGSVYPASRWEGWDEGEEEEGASVR